MIQSCSYLIRKQWFESIFKTLQGKPNTHDIRAPQGSRMATFQKLIKQIFHVAATPRCLVIPTNTDCESAAFRLSPSSSPFPRKGARPGEHPMLSIRKFCKLHRFTVAHKHGMWLVLFNGWVKGQSRTGLNRHRRGYVIKEAASRRTLLRCRVLLGPPGLKF